MKKILVVNVAASEGGALTVLEEFLKEIETSKQQSIKWTLVISNPKLTVNYSDENKIEIINLPWIKKSKLNRLFFELFYINKIIKQYKPTTIVSLQNLLVINFRIPQIIFIHQSLPFYKVRYKFTQNYKRWIKQNIYGNLLLISAKYSQAVIVQTNWMKSELLKRMNSEPSKIYIAPPTVNYLPTSIVQDTKDLKNTFFYPSAANDYKNHEVIINACKILGKKNIKNYEVVFTFNGTESELAKKLKKEVESNALNIKFQGKMARSEVFEMYSKSILLFPSKLETVGLPLLEAQTANTLILTTTNEFSVENTKDYENVKYFDEDSHRELACLMEDIIKEKILIIPKGSKQLNKKDKLISQIINDVTINCD